MNRKCKHPGCEATVPFSSKESGYCNKKRGGHWNDAESNYARPQCECGADSTKSSGNPHPKHSDWCKVYEWEKY